MLGPQSSSSTAASGNVAGRAPVHRHTSSLFPAPLFVGESPRNVFGGISDDGSHGWVVSESELFLYDLLAAGEDGPRRKAELATDLQENEERLVRGVPRSGRVRSCD